MQLSPRTTTSSMNNGSMVFRGRVAEVLIVLYHCSADFSVGVSEVAAVLRRCSVITCHGGIDSECSLSVLLVTSSLLIVAPLSLLAAIDIYLIM